MPRTPPIILPENPSTEGWFNPNDNIKDVEEEYGLMEYHELSPFPFSPSDEEESVKSQENIKRTKEYQKADTELLYHKPSSNHSTQYNTHVANKSNQKYQTRDEDNQNIEEDDSRNHISETQEDSDKFDGVVEELRKDFKIYTEEYKEFKRHVDNGKRELLEFIQNRTLYFEEKGSFIYKKWELLREMI